MPYGREQMPLNLQNLWQKKEQQVRPVLTLVLCDHGTYPAAALMHKPTKGVKVVNGEQQQLQ